MKILFPPKASFDISLDEADKEFVLCLITVNQLILCVVKFCINITKLTPGKRSLSEC